MKIVHPMLCKKGSIADLNRPGWFSEIKLDGTRGLLIKTETEFIIQNRKGVNYTRRLPEITEEAKDIQGTFVIDGEIVWFNDAGVSVFTFCQSLLARV